MAEDPWTCSGTLWYRLGPGWDPALPLAAFDFDGTLRRHRGRGPPAQTGLAVLRALALGWNLLVLDSRAGSARRDLAPLEAFIGELARAGVSCDVFAPTARDRYRKPQVGAWEVFLGARYPTAAPTPPARAASFFCGDAGGRPGDFSASDRRFAHNIGLRFRAPGQLFGGSPCAGRRRLWRPPGLRPGPSSPRGRGRVGGGPPRRRPSATVTSS